MAALATMVTSYSCFSCCTGLYRSQKEVSYHFMSELLNLEAQMVNIFFTFTNVKHTNGPDWLLFIYLVRFKEGQHLIKTKNIHKLYEVTGKSSNIRVKIQETK